MTGSAQCGAIVPCARIPDFASLHPSYRAVRTFFQSDLIWINIDPVGAQICMRSDEARKHPMKRSLTALVLAGSLAAATIATPTDAHARRLRGWGWGLGAFALGAFVGAALARPYYARSYYYYPGYYGYAYPAYSYGYYGGPYGYYGDYGGSWRGPAGYY